MNTFRRIPRNPGKFTAFALLLILGMQGSPFASPLQAQTRNPISRFFSNLLDETHAEKAVGELLETALLAEISAGGSGPASESEPRIASTTRFDEALNRIAARSPRTGAIYRIMVLKSPVPGEIPFPGGLIVLTSGLIDLAVTAEEQQFVLARNVMHVVLRHPLMIMKREGLYARALRLLKQNPTRRDGREVRNLLRDYLKAAAGMDQQRADREALTLVPNPEPVKIAAIGLLKKCSEAM